MVALITDPLLQAQLIAERQTSGTDKFDEVWEGVYVMAPLANNEHQNIVKELTTILTIVVDWAELGEVYPGVNISDQDEEWSHNYRCPNVVVFLNETRAQNRGTHWFGGPDLAIEVVSPNDRSAEKLSFYAKISTRELMLINRDPWAITFYRLDGDSFCEAGHSTLENTSVVRSELIPLAWQVRRDGDRPSIEITHRDGKQRWTVTSGKG